MSVRQRKEIQEVLRRMNAEILALSRIQRQRCRLLPKMKPPNQDPDCPLPDGTELVSKETTSSIAHFPDAERVKGATSHVT